MWGASQYTQVGPDTGVAWDLHATGSQSCGKNGCTGTVWRNTSKSQANPQRDFYTCNTKKGGCGTFIWAPVQQSDPSQKGCDTFELKRAFPSITQEGIQMYACDAGQPSSKKRAKISNAPPPSRVYVPDEEIVQKVALLFDRIETLEAVVQEQKRVIGELLGQPPTASATAYIAAE